MSAGRESEVPRSSGSAGGGMELESDRDYSELSSSLSGCTVSPRFEMKRPVPSRFNRLKLTKAEDSPRNLLSNFQNDERRRGPLHSRQRSRNGTKNFLSIDPDGLRTPGRILASSKSMGPPSAMHGGGSSWRRGNGLSGGGQRQNNLKTSRSTFQANLLNPNGSSNRNPAGGGLTQNAGEDFCSKIRETRPMFDNDSDEDVNSANQRMSIRTMPISDAPKTSPPPTFVNIPAPQPTPTHSPDSALSDTPTNYMDPPSVPRTAVSPLLTSKNSQKRQGFQWNISENRTSTINQSTLTFPSSRHNHRALSSPNLNSPELAATVKAVAMRKRNSPANSSGNRRNSKSVVPSGSGEESKSGNQIGNDIPDLKIEITESPRKFQAGTHRRSPSVQNPVIQRHRPPPLDLFEIVRLPQPIVGLALCPEIADPSRRPDSIKWYRKEGSDSKVEWILVSTEWEYTPTQKDIGHIFRVNLMVNKKPYVDFSSPVIPHPTTPSPRPWKHNKHINRSESIDHRMGKFRVLTWNTLADAATRNGFKDKCPGWALQWPYRKDNLLKHIRAFDADVICMQEVDKKHWNSHWKQCFQMLGYEGEYAGSSTYGCAMFYRTSIFRKVRHEIISLDEAANWAKEMRKNRGTESLRKKFAKMLKSQFLPSTHTQHLSEREKLDRLFDEQCRLLKCGRKALIFELERLPSGAFQRSFSNPLPLSLNLPAVPSTPMGPPTPMEPSPLSLESKRTGSGENSVFIATVHLYKSDTRPWPFIRLLQCHMVMKGISQIAKGIEQPRIVVAGDFNSPPNSSIYRYMKSGLVRAEDADIKGCAVVSCDIRNPYPLRSAYATILGHEQGYRRKKPKETPVVEYVWCSRQLGPLGVVPIPIEAAERFAVEKLSSDHQPLVVDIALNYHIPHHVAKAGPGGAPPNLSLWGSSSASRSRSVSNDSRRGSTSGPQLSPFLHITTEDDNEMEI
eukprot:CAMPEP_0184482222 /NCGR_PEP_ID=MMETSP0113_2-20130426/3793_1 /TAXON_ID=91329 /ORGANISM="Norrisiella sphaerica, Strain BC52" /LENGTH=959 /DNA_ID=CAMNT_0026861829 /DNA_START=124 /DNA_END=3003 /DNA_ORIENTATION=-